LASLHASLFTLHARAPKARAGLPLARKRAMTRQRAYLIAAAALAVACSDSSTGPTSPPVDTSPSVTSAAVTANPNNALSAIVRASIVRADSVRVRYWAGDETAELTTYGASSTADSLLLLGLRPETSYRLLVEAKGTDSTAQSDTLSFTTGAPPEVLRHTHFDFTGTKPAGYLLTALGDAQNAYITAFDSTGEVAWYRVFENSTGIGETKQQRNGDFTLYVGGTHGGNPAPGHFYEVRSDGSLARTFSAPDSAFLDNHELMLLFRDDTVYDGALFFTGTQHHVDLSAEGGSADAVVTGHQLVREDASGAQHVVFNAWDYFDPSESRDPPGSAEDYDHPNSIDVDSDGNYIVSWRTLDAITKIDAASGEVLWQLGGVKSDFTFANDPLNGFGAQHSARVLPNGNLLIFDNGTRHTSAESRAVEYHLDLQAKTATLVWQYHHTPDIYTQFTGSVERLTNGNTVVGFPWMPTFVADEVTPSGDVVWEATLHPPLESTGAPYRFIKIASLYRYETP
jgi:hypothetical protein